MSKDLAYSLDPALWCHEALSWKPDPWQQDLLRDQSHQYIALNVHRQGGKSQTVAALGTHKALFSPGSLTLCASPGIRQSSELFKKIAALLDGLEDSPELPEDNKLALTLPNHSRIVAVPGSPDTIRCYTADLLLVDEAARCASEVFAAVRPMIAIRKGRMVLLSTPNGKVNEFARVWHEGGPEWLKIKVTADQCPRISKEFLENERLNMTEAQFRQEYFGEFMEAEGAVFSSDLFKSLANPAVNALKI